MKRLRGFTVFELLIATSILLVVFGVIFRLFHGMEVHRMEHERRNWHAFESARVARLLGRDVESSAGRQGRGSDLTLTAPDAAPVRYRLEGTTLMRSGAHGEESLAHDLSEATFSVDGPTVRLRIVYTSRDPLSTRHQQEDFVVTSRLGGAR